MPIAFEKAFELMKEKGLTSYRIRKDKIITETTLQRMRQNGNVTTDAIGNLCKALNCQPGDLMEWVPDEEPLK